jgi:hypothetical protein
VVWRPEERPWQYDLLDRLPPGVDRTLIEEARKKTPTERLEQVRAFVEFLDELRRARERRLP